MDINDSNQHFVDEDDKLIIIPPSAEDIKMHRIKNAYKKLDEVIEDIEYMEMVHLVNAEEVFAKLRTREQCDTRDTMIRMAEDKIASIQREIERLVAKRNHIVKKIEHLEEDEPKNRCVECGVDMGIDNPRQYCGKTQCDSL
jgi:E3 ubiquitin-protein ligase DOA10